MGDVDSDLNHTEMGNQPLLDTNAFRFGKTSSFDINRHLPTVLVVDVVYIFERRSTGSPENTVQKIYCYSTLGSVTGDIG